MVIEASAAPAAVGVEAADFLTAATQLGGRNNRECSGSSGPGRGDAHPRQGDVVLNVRVFMKWSKKNFSMRKKVIL